MKTECDAHGLEYEILMQESAKARFLRQVKQDGFDINDLSKHLVILKQKRNSNSTDPKVAAANPSDPTVAAPNAEDEKVAGPLAISSMAGFKAIAGLTSGLTSGLTNGLPRNWNIPRILVDARNAQFPRLPSPAPLPTISLKPVTFPPMSSLPTPAPLPAIKWPPAPRAGTWSLLGAKAPEASAGPIVSPNSR